ncbi:hypothetical protein [Salisediminibacterium selenitireducens]|uniref:Uncharacterized protein n=1 Tax=Bacillus selenitireducens (strain ATCC 700615 / DSM 15326 / MLS10) TaxID=439292 RepID=D6XX68_BACIE|nr:hypothetical protein [Salisediminibacterium selenitireducens]ADH97925.1 hypothetical protein Bsel_0385 [[Bacillus] selenitireducens MLS10]
MTANRGRFLIVAGVLAGLSAGYLTGNMAEGVLIGTGLGLFMLAVAKKNRQA